MSVTPSGGWFVVKNLQYAEEATYGTFPTNPAMNWVAVVANVDLKGDMGTIMVPQLGTEDLKYLLKGAQYFNLDIEYAFQNSTFAKYATQSQGGGSGSIDKSLSLLFSAKMNTVENFFQILGSRVGDFSITGKYGDLIRAKATVTAQSIPIPSTTNPIGTGSFATDPATVPWSFYDGGANPVTIGAVSPDVREIQVNFARNLEKLHVLGLSTMKFLPPKQRRVSGTFTIVWEDINQYTSLVNATNNTITWVLKSGVSTLTLTGVELTKLDSQKFDPQEIVYEKYGFTALTDSLS